MSQGIERFLHKLRDTVFGSLVLGGHGGEYL